MSEAIAFIVAGIYVIGVAVTALVFHNRLKAGGKSEATTFELKVVCFIWPLFWGDIFIDWATEKYL